MADCNRDAGLASGVKLAGGGMGWAALAMPARHRACSRNSVNPLRGRPVKTLRKFRQKATDARATVAWRKRTAKSSEG